MSLTNQEMEIIYKTAVKLHNPTVYPEVGGDKNSFFQDRDKLKLIKDTIYEYSFSTPVEFQKMLENMWAYQNNEYMREFIRVCTVAVFKNKPVQEDIGESSDTISSFIYEF